MDSNLNTYTSPNGYPDTYIGAFGYALSNGHTYPNIHGNTTNALLNLHCEPDCTGRHSDTDAAAGHVLHPTEHGLRGTALMAETVASWVLWAALTFAITAGGIALALWAWREWNGE